MSLTASSAEGQILLTDALTLLGAAERTRVLEENERTASDCHASGQLSSAG